MNSWSFRRSIFLGLIFLHLILLAVKRCILFLSSEPLLVCCVCSPSLEKAGRKKQKSCVGMGAQERENSSFMVQIPVFSLLHCRKHIVCICAFQCSSTPTVLRLLAVGFPLKNYFCGNVCFAKYCICSTLVSVKGSKTLMCQLLKGALLL